MASHLSISNPNPQRLPGPQLLHDLVPQEAAEGVPAIEHTAEDGSQTRLQYGEFHSRAEALARRIASATEQLGSKRNIVPILIPQCPELYISQLASLKAGAAFCPIVLDAPEERLRFILQDIEAQVLLTTVSLKERLPTLDNLQIITVDEVDNDLEETAQVNRPIKPQDAAYVMYTSGSTGQPKGVIISHLAATQALLAHDSHIPKFSRFLQFASPTFDVSVFEIFFPWFRRSTLVSCDRRRLLNDLPSAINKLEVDACELTPSVASSLLRGRKSVPSLKVLLTIGEMLKPSVVEDFGGSAAEPAILHGMYGPTEATIHCTLQTAFPKDMACGIIGKPLETVSAFVVKTTQDGTEANPNLEILPTGEEGELAVGGYQLADGYLNREKQTRAAFVQHPQYGTLYRTGDLARMLPDGKLECLGRISNGQVKLRGQRIELGEIEHAASRTPGCRDVVAEVISGVLVVFCVRESGSFDKSDVLNTCRQWLPAFMVPGDAVILDSLPYLASGKCDRKVLRTQYSESQKHDDVKQSDGNETIRRVLAAVGDVLGVSVEAESPLPGLGMDSLSSIRIAGALRKAGFQQLDASQVLAAYTPAEIATLLESTHDQMAQSDADSYRPLLDEAITRSLPTELQILIEDCFPCTPVQIAMLAETHKRSQAYCNWVEFFIVGFTDCSTVDKALQKLAGVHPLLRSGFLSAAGTPWSYATVVWRSLWSRQIERVSSFKYDFQIVSDEDLLHPSRFQLVPTSKGCRVLFQAHHSIFDQWSIDVLQDHLGAILKGQQPASTVSFKPVADYYVNRLEQPSSSSDIQFWQDYLRAVSPTTLPLLRGREVPNKLQRTEWHDLALEASVVKTKLKEIGSSSPALFQAVLATLLGAYTGSSDVTLGSVFSGRSIPVDGIDSIFGPCLATLPFRVDTSTARSCADLLAAVTERTRTMQNHVLTTPTAIREAAGIAPGATLFDTLFVWQESSFHRDSSANVVQSIDSEDQLEFNLVMEFEPSPTRIRVRATYQQSLISSDQVQMLLRQIDALSSKIFEDPKSLTKDLHSNLGPDLMSIYNPQPIEYGPSFDLVSVIQGHAFQQPSAKAVLFANTLHGQSAEMTSISYMELESRSNQMAHAFIASGLQPEGLVCICMEKGIDLYVAMLAAFKSGAGYLPLIPETPTGRIRSVLAQSDVDICVCDADTYKVFHELTNSPVLDVTSLDLSKSPAAPPSVTQSGSRISYAVYTSGSTGEPKGVAVTMDNLKGNLAVLGELYSVDPGDRLLQACSQAFDVSVFEIFFAFYSGMCLCSASKDVMFHDFEHSIRKFEVTHLSLTPTVAALVTPENVPSVKFLVTAGEGITEKVHRLWSGKGLHQGYGPSETTNICSVRMHHAPEDVIGNIGPPFRNTSAFVLSPQDDFRILPAGAYGEFAFGGEQVFRGYIGRDDLNREKIIQHPQYGRIYKSGDMGRILFDGTLLISGRLDDQVKIRGNRVELGEINTVVSDHSEVLDCTTLVLGEGSSKQTLVTFFVPKSLAHDRREDVTTAEVPSTMVSQLFDRLEEAVPAYMMPSTMVPLNRLPMTSQGKLDKRLLRGVLQSLDSTTRDKLSRSHEAGDGEGPASPTEQTIADELARILEVPASNISRHTSFFALGLNSLNAIQLAKGLQRSLGVTVGVTAILKHSSLARLSKALSNSVDEPREDHRENTLDVFSADIVKDIMTLLSAASEDVEAIFPCTPLQQAMLSASVAANEAYCNTTKLSIHGDVDKLERIWQEMTRRHAILRTRFVETPLAAHPHAQVVLREPPRTWFNIRKDSPVPNGAPNGHTKGNGNGYAVPSPALPPITPESPLRIDQDGPDLYLQMHHAIYDGISVSNLFSEIEKDYRGERLQPAVSFEPFLNEVMSQNGQEALQFWSERIRGFQPTPFPTLDATADEGEMAFDLDIPIQPAELDAFCERHSLTSLSVFQAAWAKSLACAQGLSDICFGNVVSGRSISAPDIDRLVAPCFNTVPVRSRLRTVRTNLALMQNLHQSNLETLPFQLTAPRRVQALSQQPSQHLFDSILLLQPPQEEYALWSIEEDDMDMGIPFAVEVIPRQGSYNLQVHYLPDKVPQTTATALAEGFVASLMSCVRYPSSAVSHFLDFDDARIAGRLAPETSHKTLMGDMNGNTVNPSNERWSKGEDAVRHVFAELAEVEASRISKHTSLYQIGLDSLNAVQVANRLRKQGYKVDAVEVMQHQTPTALASLVSSTQNGTASEEPPAIDLASFDSKHRAQITRALGLNERKVEAIRPCTPTQSGMLAQFLQSQGSYYMSYSVYDIPKDLSFGDIKAAWEAVQRRHQVLRMGFHPLEDASLPFAMIIHSPDQVFDSTVLSEEHHVLDAFETAAQRSVFETLHLPAWRFCVQSSSKGRQMSLSLHHALYDADSLQVLLNDFALAIHGHHLGRALDIDPVLTNQLDGAANAKSDQERFWKEALQSARSIKFPNLTPSIVSEPRTGVASHASSVEMCVVDSFCQSEGVTIQALGQSIWGMILACYLGEPEVTFGTVFSGMANVSEPVAFPAISTVPVLCNTSKDSVAVLKDMVSYNASAQRHRFTPLADIQRYAGSAGQSLFDTIFVYQKASEEKENAFDWHAVHDSLGIDYIASMEMEVPDQGNVHLRLTYDARSIPDEHASLLVKQYDMLLQSVLEGSEDTEANDKSIMSFVPPNEATLPCTVDLLHQFVERGARDHPERPALEFIHTLEGGEKGRKKWSYKQLDERSNQVAHLIQHRSVQPGSIVSVCMSKSAEATFAFVGILKAGCAFLAMDPDLPLARRRFIMEDSQSQLLFVDCGKSDPEMQEAVEIVELVEENLDSLPKSAVDIAPMEPSATSYCLYTSGTTGTPKGCELTHENAVQAMMSFQRLFSGHWTEQSRWLQFASYWFDVSVLEQFWSWSVGITVVGAPRDLVLEDLAGFIREANITHIDLTPSLARLLTPQDVPSLCNHVFITGGEALKQEIIDRWGPAMTICNGYGPTEATIGVTMNPFIGTNAKPSNIGPPFDNVGAYVFAPGTDEIVLRGAVGELCISGKLVGKGYLNRPDLTAKAFPYLERHGERVYRTGDLVRLLADDSVSFIGRADTQAKLRGQRLEIDEIDAVIKSSATDVSDVASLVVKSNEGNREMLVSFIVNEQARSRDLQTSNSSHSLELVETADQACRDRLPGYMVPTHIITLSRLPLTVNNKVDTKRLVALFSSMTTQDLQRLKGADAASRPLKPTEQKIADILARLLSIEASEIAPGSNVFSLGLSSISAINFASSLKRNGFKTASVAAIMRNPSIQTLSKALSDDDSESRAEQNAIKQAQLTMTAFARRYRGTAAQALSVDASTIESLAPCTPLQEGLLVESMKSAERPYFNHFWYDVTGLDLQRLKTSIERLWQLVSMLRSAFIRTDEGFSQVVTNTADFAVQFISTKLDDFEHVLGQKKASWVQEATHDVLKPFEAVLVQTTSKVILAFNVHHALYDGISWDLMMDKLGQIYRSDTSPDIGPKFLDALPHSPLCQHPGSKSYWQRKLQDMQFCPLPVTSSEDKGQGVTVTRQMRFSEHLESLRRQLGVSHQAIVQAAFAIALHQLSPQTQCYGVVLSGRSINFEHADIVIGPMFNTVPSVVDLQTSDDWKQLLQRCHQANAEVIPFQHTPLRDIRKFCARHPSDPMFDVLFVFQRPQNSQAAPEDALFKSIETQTPAEYPLAVEVELLESGNINITTAAQQKYANVESLNGLIQSIETALNCMSKDVEQPVSARFNIESRSTSSAQDPEPKGMPQLDGSADEFEWTPEARVLQETIANVIGCNIDDVTEHTAIFTLGLDSIDAVKLASRLKKAGLAIPVSQILKAQTIPKMLDALQSETSKSSQASTQSTFDSLQEQLQVLHETLDDDSQDGIESIIPATPGQEALVADMLRSGFREYYNSDILKLRGDVDLEKLKSAWQAVVDASPILRTSFAEVSSPDIDAVFAQIVHRSAELEFTELSVSSIEELDEYIEQVRIDAMATFTQVPPLRLAIATVKSEQYLVLSMAHAQYDGHSLTLLHEDVAKAYSGSLDDRPPYDGAVDLALNATNEDAVSFWRDTLSGAKFTHLSRKTSPSDETTYRAERVTSTSTNVARSFCKKLGISLQALAQASWSLLLANYAQRLEVLFGIVLACRDSEEAEQILFPTMNTVPMRASLHGSGSEMLRYIQSINNDMRPYQRTPLRAIQSACAGMIEMPNSQSGLFDSLFIYQQRPDADGEEQAPLYESIDGNSNVEYPVAVEVEAVGSELLVRAACKSKVQDKEGTHDLLRKFDRVLSQLVDTPEKPAVEFSGDQVSICGLPPFQLQDDILTRQASIVQTSSHTDEGVIESPFEATIRSALAQVAKVSEDEVDSNSRIEAIGIDSISAIKVTAILRKESIKLPVSSILKAQTPRKMAELVESNTATPASNDATVKEVIAQSIRGVDLSHVRKRIGVEADGIEDVMPATAGQLYMISMWRMTQGELFYPTFTYMLKAKSSRHQIRAAWSTVVSRHTVLRTVFTTGSYGTPLLQVILKKAPESIVFHDSGSEPAPATQPMVLLHVLEADEGYELNLKIHHALYDAVSLPVVMQDLESAIVGASSPSPRVNFQSFLALSLRPEAQRTKKDFWTKYLWDVRPAQLRQPGPQASRKAQIYKPIVFSSCAKLEQQARAAHVTVQALLFAIYAKIYTQHASEAEDVVFGIYLANRSHLPDLDRLAAPTLNLLPLVVRQPKHTSIVEAAKKTDSDLRAIASVENSTASLAEIAERTGVKVDSFVNFLKLPEQSEKSPSSEDRGVSITPVEEWSEETSRVVEPQKASEHDFIIPKGLEDFKPSEAYQHALDMEISMVNGKLSIGLFCLEEMMNLEEGEMMIGAMREELERAVEGV